MDIIPDENGENQRIGRTVSHFKSIHFRVGNEVVKISRGEERIFVWAIFLTLLELIIDDLNESDEESDFRNFRYIYIDDPISSLDDNNIINSAIFLKDVIAKAENTGLTFVLSTHQPLFYNVLYNEIRFDKRIKKKSFYVMKRYEDTDGNPKYVLTDVEKDSPFGYHLKVREELRKATATNQVEKFHFALFRNLAEKTATFLGYGRWEQVLLGLKINGDVITDKNIGLYTQRIDSFTHNRQSDLEYRELFPQEKVMLIELFQSFEETYQFKKLENENHG